MILKTERLQEYTRLQVVSYGIDYVARPLLLFFSFVWKKVDTTYQKSSIRRIKSLRYGVLGFLGVGTTFDIFQNLHILYQEYGVLPSSGYGVLILFSSWSSVKCRHKYTISSLMDMAYWMSESVLFIFLRLSSRMLILPHQGEKDMRPTMAASTTTCCPTKIRANFTQHDPSTTKIDNDRQDYEEGEVHTEEPLQKQHESTATSKPKRNNKRPTRFNDMVVYASDKDILDIEGDEMHGIKSQGLACFSNRPRTVQRNKAKPEGSIAEGYVAEEALTFSSHYFRDVTTKFNRPDRNVDPPPPTCQFQVFRSVCKSIGLRSVIRFDAQELKKVKWYVLHNSPEIDTYRSQFKSLFPNKDMKEEFPEWFGSQTRQRHVDNDKDPEVSTTSELFALAWDDPDIIHFDNSYDLPLSTSLNDLDNVTLHIDGQSTEVDAPPDIIDVVDQDNDITDDEDALPHDLADSDDEDLINVDDDGVEKFILVKKKIDLELCQQMLPGPTSVTVAVRIVPLHTMYPPVAWAALLTETEFDLRSHMESPDWTEINAGIQQHLQKAYNTNKAAFKAQHWVINPTTGTYNVEKIKRARPEDIRQKSGISIFSFGMISGTLPEPLKIGKTEQRARSYLDWDPSRLLAFEMRW
ncbi:hypothetical protein Tco_1481976 [Tanacetum coccineum]